MNPEPVYENKSVARVYFLPVDIAEETDFVYLVKTTDGYWGPAKNITPELSSWSAPFYKEQDIVDNAGAFAEWFSSGVIAAVNSKLGLAWAHDGFSAAETPRDNDGRTICFWCKAPTKKIQGFSSNYDVCTKCGK